MSLKEKTGLSKLFDFLAKLFAFVVLGAMIFQNLVGLGWFGDGEILVTIAKVAHYVLIYAAIGLAALTALEFSTNHGFFLTLIILVIIAVALIPSFFPSVWKQILDFIGK